MTEHTHHDDGLSPAARAALASLRAADDLPADARARMWARLEAAQVPSDMSQGPAWRRSTGLVIGLALAAGVALAVVNLGRGAQQVAVAPHGDAAAYGSEVARPQPVRPQDRTPVVPAVATVVSAPEPTPATATATAATAQVRERREPVRDEPVPADTSTLAAETALLQRAQSALADGDPGAALVRLDEHREGFADGVLAREREALRVTALCDAGRREDSRAAAAAFIRRHPRSMLADRVQGVCVTP